MSFPKKGKFFPKENQYKERYGTQPEARFVSEIASALQRSLGDRRAGAKTVAAWTGANEKTVKNWFSGIYGPSGQHLVALVRHSDVVLGAFLAMAGREELTLATNLLTAEQAIAELLDSVRRLGGDGQRGPVK